MTKDQVIQIASMYSEKLARWGFEPANAQDRTDDAPGVVVSLGHAGWMCDKIVEFANQGKMPKAFRWLGFVQGRLEHYEFYTIAEMREHNGPDEFSPQETE